MMDILPVRVTLKDTVFEVEDVENEVSPWKKRQMSEPVELYEPVKAVEEEDNWWRRQLSEPVKVKLFADEPSSDEGETNAVSGSSTPDGSQNSSNEALPAQEASSHVLQANDFGEPFTGNNKMLLPELGLGGKTLSVRNLPPWYTQEMLLEELMDCGFRVHREFDICYLPIDPRTGMSFGVCFVNFFEEAVAHAFEAALGGRTLRLAHSELPIEVSRTKIEDLEQICAWRAGGATTCWEAMAPPPPLFGMVAQPPLMMPCGAAPQPQARFCPQCGSTIDVTRFNFCSQCGSSVAHLRR